MNLAAVDITQLSPRLRLIVETIGLPAAIKLVNARGGRFVKIPKGGGKQLAQIIGEEAAQKMSNRFYSYPPPDFYVPKKDRVTRQIRNLEIVAQLNALTLREVAERFDLSVRQVINIRDQLLVDTGSSQGRLL